jgi:UDP-glucose 4-epimerase
VGYKTIIVDNLDNSSLSVLENIWQILGYKPDFYEIDIRNLEEMKKVFEKYNFDWVIHFAWLKAVWESCKKPLKYFDNNIIWSIKLFELMEKFKVKNLIFSSSATVYDWDNDLPYEEWYNVWETSNPYWTTKFLIEKILEDLTKFSFFNVINLRYFNPIWAHPSGLIWEDPKWIPNNLFPYIMKVATWELSELKIFWNDYDTKDGTGVRDYIDINDLVEWHIKAYEFLKLKGKSWKLKEKSNCHSEFISESLKINSSWEENLNREWFFETFNLWVGKWISVLELLKVCEKISGKKIPYSVIERRSWDLGKVYCSPEKAEKVLWWKAKISIEESVKNGLNYIYHIKER